MVLVTYDQFIQAFEKHSGKKGEYRAQTVGNIIHFYATDRDVFEIDYNDAIKLAEDIDDMELYSIAVITMMNIFDAGTCYGEYCESEFNNGEWESIALYDIDDETEDEEEIRLFDESPFFYIRPAKF
ncbi:hypothetical protein [Spirosoma litoris]